MSEIEQTERKRIAVELTEKTELTYKEIGDLLDRSQAWVDQERNRYKTETTEVEDNE